MLSVRLEYHLPRRRDCDRLPMVTPSGSAVLQFIVSVLLVVPLHEPVHPLSSRLEAFETESRIFGTVFVRPEESLQIGIIVACPRTTVRVRFQSL